MKVCSKCSGRYDDDAGFCPTDGTPLAVVTDPFIGRTIAGRYRILRKLGQGGMSVVYLAEHVVIERLSAIKILRRDLTRDPQHRERFLREARAVNRIHHPSIVEISDLGEVDGTAYLVMEYADGESLHDTLKRGVLPWRRAVRIAAQVAAALARAHAAGVIHRDLKPENVLILRSTEADKRRGEGGDRVKLTDFGIAKLLDAPALTLSEQTFGTPGYIPPEVVGGAKIDARGDLYGLGVLMYESLTGRLPFDAASQIELLMSPLTKSPIPLTARSVTVPAEVEALIMQLLARAPDDRPADAFAVEDALGALLQRAPSADDVPQATLIGRDTISHTSVEATPQQAPRTTENVGWLLTSASSSRWGALLIDARKHIDARARTSGFAPDGLEVAEALYAHAAELITQLDRTTTSVAGAQTRLEALEAHARAFRESLGGAIEQLGRDRSRQRAHYSELLVKESRLDGADMPADAGDADALLWERAAVSAGKDRARSGEQDLAFQMVQLQLKLEAEHEQHERLHAATTAELEGAIATTHAMQADLTQTIDALRQQR